MTLEKLEIQSISKSRKPKEGRSLELNLTCLTSHESKWESNFCVIVSIILQLKKEKCLFFSVTQCLVL